MSADWWKCPNDPPCPHASVVHDVYDSEDEVPRCCIEGCDCGKRPPGQDGPLTREEYAAIAGPGLSSPEAPAGPATAG